LNPSLTLYIQNVTFALGTKAIMLGLTFAGLISLGVAIAVDVGSMLIVTLNGVSLLESRAKAQLTPIVVSGEEMEDATVVAV
jgi:cation transport ATPase